MALTPITPLPTAPSRSMAATVFVATANAFVAALVTLVAQLNNFIAELTALGNTYLLTVSGTSTTSLTIGTGSKTLTTQTGLGHRIGTTIYVADASGNKMWGPTTAYNSSTGSLTFLSVGTIGSGSGSSWTIGPETSTGAKANLSQTAVIPKGNSGTGTVTFDVAVGEVQTVTNTGAHTWAFTWPTGHSEILVKCTNAGAYAITLPAGVRYIIGDGTYSTTFSDMGVTLQASGMNRFSFETDDGGTTVYCIVS